MSYTSVAGKTMYLKKSLKTHLDENGVFGCNRCKTWENCCLKSLHQCGCRRCNILKDCRNHRTVLKVSHRMEFFRVRKCIICDVEWRGGGYFIIFVFLFVFRLFFTTTMNPTTSDLHLYHAALEPGTSPSSTSDRILSSF